MSTESRIAAAINTLVVKSLGSGDKPDMLVATVDSVDVDTRTCACTLVSGVTDVQLGRVRLMATLDDGMLLVPAVGSTVIIESTHNTDPIVIMFSQLDKVLTIAGGSTLQIDADGLKLNGDQFGGIPVLVKPDDSDAGVLARLNKIEQWQNGFTSKWNAFCTAYVPGSPTVTGLPATLASSTTTNLTNTTRAQLENKKVVQGDGS